jgi:hypothetical protein
LRNGFCIKDKYKQRNYLSITLDWLRSYSLCFSIRQHKESIYNKLLPTDLQWISYYFIDSDCLFSNYGGIKEAHGRFFD